jgi:ferrous iron transport protein A
MSSWHHPPTLPAAHMQFTLASVPLRQRFTIVEVQAPEQMPEWASALDELGFVPGEDVELVARGLPGGDPLVVRVGCSTYALRGAEAACVRVVPR